MIATLSLVSCVLATAQPADRSEWLLLPRLNPAQEMVYRGSFEEQAAGGEVQFTRGYRLHHVVYVLDASSREAEVAFLTILRQRQPGSGRLEEAPPSSVRVEVFRVDSQGRLGTGSGPTGDLPLEGPPPVELGTFVEVPRHYLGRDSHWSVEETNRPPRHWTVVGTDTVNATTCVKLAGIQKSEDWDKPRADTTAWRRLDTLWVAPRLGIAYRVERVIERRPPAQGTVAYKSVMCYELEQRTEYPRSIRDDIRREITQARTFAELANPLLPAPAKYTSQIETLLGRIAYHQQHYAAPPPYAEALLHLQRRLEAARRGEAAPTPPPPEPGTSALAALGRPAPEFVIPDFTSPQSAGLHRWKGKPILMVFYNPKSILVEEVLQLAQEVQNAGRGEVAVLALAMSQDAEAVRQQRANLHLSVPVLNGTGLRQSYGVEATPKLMVVDDRGILRGSYVGWGQETRTAVMADLKPWLLRKSSLPR